MGDLARSFDHMRIDIGRQQAEIRNLAYRDRLTGLPNRERFRAAVLDALRADPLPGHSLAVLMLDLDRFKHVNDVLGYAFGDRLLQAVAGRLQPMAGTPGDMVARHGGNEFALLLHVADAQAALRVAERIARAFETSIQFDDQTVDLSASMGIALWPEHAQDADMLLNRAEIAMYGAKKRLSVALLYDPALDSSSAQTLSLLGDLRRAVEHGELRLYLQPKVALQAGVGAAAEALLRWQHPQRGLVPPGDFIPLAEESGLIGPLTEWVLETACADQRQRADAGLPVLPLSLIHI